VQSGDTDKCPIGHSQGQKPYVAAKQDEPPKDAGISETVQIVMLENVTALLESAERRLDKTQVMSDKMLVAFGNLRKVCRRIGEM